MKHLNNNKGMAALIALIMVGMLTLIGLAAMSTSDDEVEITSNQLQETRAFYAAEAGLERAAATLHHLSDSLGTSPSYMPSGSDEVNNCVYKYETVDLGPAQQRVLNNGTLAGLRALVKSYAMESTGYSKLDKSKVKISQNFERALVPIFQFAVFYNNDLEIAPGADMGIIGRVHTNGNLYLQSASALQLESFVTAAGNLYHGRKGPGAVDNGDLEVKDGTGTFVSMKDGADWLESTDSYWYDSSVARWNGRVQDSTHGQTTLNMPLNNASGDPHAIIERSNGGANTDSYEDKAEIKFIDGQAYQQLAGLWINVTADMVVKGIISQTDDKFYDQRESEWVDVTELDMQKLYDEGYAPLDGVVYFSDNTSDFPALRVSNGADIDSSITIVSENPVYIQGDFNSANKQPAAIMADAVTFLSSNFNDSLSTNPKSDRVAVNTTVNASIMTGNTETTASDYNGGLENLPRFLEDWDGKTFTWSGSMVNLWNSVQADGNWNGSYYNPPTRNWSYDFDLDNPDLLPPGTPMFRVFQRTGWSEEHIGLYTIQYDSP